MLGLGILELVNGARRRRMAVITGRFGFIIQARHHKRNKKEREKRIVASDEEKMEKKQMITIERK